MSYPNIRSRRENYFNHWISPMQNRINFLNRNPNAMALGNSKPPVNISKDTTIMEMEVVIPGFQKSELSVTVNGKTHTVTGEK